jgi:polyphosphate kinase 2 (PPK2 family)
MSSKSNSGVLSEKKQRKATEYFKSEEHYEKQLATLQKRLIGMQQKLFDSGGKLVLVFEGPDSAGKGGVIRRITEHLDLHGIRVNGISAPSEQEKRQVYLERFWSRLPEPGSIAIFDRSWYGRVLVERVEGYAKPKDWKRAYDEINAFERILTDNGVVLIKFLLDIDYEEQGRRFEERKKDPFKAWKLTSDDWRNRRKWTAYRNAFEEMVDRTSPKHAPWNVIAANSKWFARVKVIETLLRAAADPANRA